MSKEIRIHPLSWSSLKIDMYLDDDYVACGTCFIKRDAKGENFIITNWHNVTGYHPEKKTPLSESGVIPNNIRIAVHSAERSGKWIQMTVSLYDDENGLPTWYEHPVHKSKVDVIAIPIEEHESVTLYAIDDFHFDEIYKPGIAEDVFIMGFPRGITSMGNFPIWKRGSIATDLDLDIDGLPKLLIDSATREGLSGSPVIAKHSGIVLDEPGKVGPNSIIGTVFQFLGVYSGRIMGKDELESQLGIVWKKSVIKDILEARELGEFKLPSI
jgi:hypothetical protein